ncbi:hypothetical protein FRC08_012703 [Ceratobasidium sp. 394]|nr:hypothetical protein FRC08_012703 [Ceratobasidium sp. 394]
MPINVAIVGVGLVGVETISQLSRLTSQFRIIALSNSKKLLFNPSGVSLSSWQSDLASSGSTPDLETLAAELARVKAGGERVALVDNTSSEVVAGLYPSFLSAGIDVVTPNKKAYSSDLGLYTRIKEASVRTGARYLNESTVGAGLPIISTLKDLIATGDKIIKIEGVLSGTLSYIFNEYSKPGGGDAAFSSIVKVAREKGYTARFPTPFSNIRNLTHFHLGTPPRRRPQRRRRRPQTNHPLPHDPRTRIRPPTRLQIRLHHVPRARCAQRHLLGRRVYRTVARV